MLQHTLFRQRILLVGFICSGIIATAQTPVANKPTTVTQIPSIPANTVKPIPPAYNISGTAPKINYVRTREALGRYTNEGTFSAQNYLEAKETTHYIDGLGRPLQSVMRQLSPGASPKDMVAPTEYDAFGREQFKYLPYVQTTGISTNDGKFKLSPFADQAAFFQNTSLNPGHSGEQVYYSQTVFEASPLNRPTKSLAPGNSWGGSNVGVSMEYLVNTSSDDTRIWNIINNPLTYLNNDVSTNIPSSTAAYAAGQLYKTVTKDEKGDAVIEYKDKEGQVVLKKVQIGTIATDYSGYSGFLSTYYVYDDLNRLRFVIPPKAVEAIKATWTFSNDIINELCFRYEYDYRSRMIAKKVPGAGWVYMVYDKRDRLVFTQDANMASKSPAQWMATLYDVLNRPVLTGIITYAGNRDALQIHLDGTMVNSSSVITIINPLPVDLSVNFRQIGKPDYRASNSIEFVEGFESETGALFETFIEPGGTSEIIEVGSDPLPAGNNFIALTITYYDNYNWTSRSYNSTYNNKPDAGANLHAEPIPTISLQQQVQTKGMVTGMKVRVLENPNNLATGIFLASVNFYDDRGRSIQVQADNYKGGTDIITNLYDFNGKSLSSYMVHNNPAANKTMGVLTNMSYDHAGRLLTVQKKIFNDPAGTVANLTTTILQNDYDYLGQLKQKRLGQQKDINGAYTTIPLETLDFIYNIRGWLKGINKDYANDPSPTGNRWFGMELNYDWGFGSNQQNGNIAGMKWKSTGDDERRAYGFTYDKANRILGGDFSQQNGTAYIDHGIVNYDMIMGNGSTASAAYDENGNIKLMKQWGLKLGSSTAIDDMLYTYHTNSNKLRAVTEQTTGTTVHTLGDFTDKNTSADDYGYDKNGNIISDLNKRMNGVTNIDNTTGGAIIYNHLNLPYQITVKSDDGLSTKGTITYIYDATGNKLEKRVVDNTNLQNPNKKTSYLGPFVYETVLAAADQLQFFGHEEGRIRPIAIPAGTWVADYFIKDHLGNTRMVLTDEQKKDIYQAGMEVANQAFEVALFGNKITTTAITKPGGFDGVGSNQRVSAVNGLTAEGRVGPGVILKVMAGDKINAKAYSWYQPTGMDFSTNSGLAGIVTNLLGQLVPGVSFAGKGTAAEQITSGLLQPGMNNFLSNQSPPAGTPKAYLNWVLLDEEQFTKVAASSGFQQVQIITGAEQKKLVLANGGGDIEMTKNGYLYVYVSNESKGNVYFDDIRVDHIRGSLTEETHYYPFGLVMSGISSKAANFGGNTPSSSGGCGCPNKKGFNGNEIQQKEFSDGSGLEVYDFNARTYDQQIGRFIQIDPVPDEGEQESLSPYHFAGNNPILYNDPDGKCPWCVYFVAKFVVGAAIEYGSQVYDNYKSGKTGADAWKPTSVGKILLNGATSTVDPSGGVVKKVAITTATNVVESVGGQLLDGKKVTLSNTVKDVAVMTVSGAVKVDGSKAVNKLEKNADKLERVAKNSPSTRNGVQATEARAAANGANLRNQTAETATTEATESGLGKKVDQINFSGGNGVGGFNPNAPRVDNTFVRKPIILPLRQ